MSVMECFLALRVGIFKSGPHSEVTIEGGQLLVRFTNNDRNGSCNPV